MSPVASVRPSCECSTMNPCETPSRCFTGTRVADSNAVQERRTRPSKDDQRNKQKLRVFKNIVCPSGKGKEKIGEKGLKPPMRTVQSFAQQSPWSRFVPDYNN